MSPRRSRSAGRWIEIKFRRAPVWMFRTVGTEELRRNTLLLTLQPDEGFTLYFDVKAPGKPFQIHRLPLDFRYAEVFERLKLGIEGCKATEEYKAFKTLTDARRAAESASSPTPRKKKGAAETAA